MDTNISGSALQEVSLDDLDRLLVKLEQPEEDDFFRENPRSGSNHGDGITQGSNLDITQLLTNIKQEAVDSISSDNHWSQHGQVTNSSNMSAHTEHWPLGGSVLTSRVYPTMNLRHVDNKIEDTTISSQSPMALSATPCSDALSKIVSNKQKQKETLSPNGLSNVLEPTTSHSAVPGCFQFTEQHTSQSAGQGYVQFTQPQVSQSAGPDCFQFTPHQTSQSAGPDCFQFTPHQTSQSAGPDCFQFTPHQTSQSAGPDCFQFTPHQTSQSAGPDCIQLMLPHTPQSAAQLGSVQFTQPNVPQSEGPGCFQMTQPHIPQSEGPSCVQFTKPHIPQSEGPGCVQFTKPHIPQSEGPGCVQFTQPHIPQSEGPGCVQFTQPHTLQHAREVTGGNVFHVDTSQLTSVPVSDQAKELRNLGLTVYNQDTLEEDIMAQVDQAMEQQEQERLRGLMEKQLKAVTDDIRTVRQELANVEKVLKSLVPLIANGNREARRKLDAVKRQKENKQKQLKKLKAKQRSLNQKLSGSTEGLNEDDEALLAEDGPVNLEQALGLGPRDDETETERMIRQGEMTPFGTITAGGAPGSGAAVSTGPRLSSNGQMTDFEKYLLDQTQKGLKRKPPAKKSSRPQEKSQGDSRLKRKVKKCKEEEGNKKLKMSRSKSAPSLSTMSSSDSSRGNACKDKTKRPNLFDSKDKRRYRPSEYDFSNTRNRRPHFARLQHNFSEDRRLSDYDEEDNDRDSDYIPNEDMINEDEQFDIKESRGPAKKRRKSKKQNHQSFSDDDGSSSEEGHREVRVKKNGVSGNRKHDDGSFKCYKDRIKAWQRARLEEKQDRIQAGEPDSDDSDFEDVEVDGDFRIPAKVWSKLYQYQKTCVKWLWELHGQKTGGIVGDEMGLGKTIQIISFLTGLKVSKVKDRGAGTKYIGLGPVLIVCPATVMHQWVREFHKWWPTFRVAVLHASGSFTTSVAQLVDDIVSCHGVLVTSYGSLTINQDTLHQYDWHYIILDEGHKIRNPDAQVTIASKQFRTCHRLILSGSPVQNNLKELWSLFDFIFPGKLGTLPDFMAHFAVPIIQGGYSTASQVQVQTAFKCASILRDTINPYLLRRMKQDVQQHLSLPSKNEQVLFCRLTDDQRDVYKEYLDSKECNMILSGKFMVFPGLITLRKVCNHPDLSTGGPQEFDLAMRDYDNTEEREYGHWKRSGKMIVVRSLLQLWAKQGQRVLLFSQSKQMLDILESFVNTQGYKYLRMDGGTSISARQPLINKFNQDPSYFIFLLTTRVGGLGINLTGANRVVIYDPDWNPSTDTQARERAWRIGQTRQVTIYRLLTVGTIEEKIYHRQIFKQFLTNRVLKDPKQRRLFKANDLFELFTLSDIDPRDSTETSAIFAGTGSDVKIKRRTSQPRPRAKSARKSNRFDELLAKKQKAKVAGNTEPALDDDDDVEMAPSVVEEVQEKASNFDHSERDSADIIDEEKKAKMRELAKRLSSQLGAGQSFTEQETQPVAGKSITDLETQPMAGKSSTDLEVNQDIVDTASQNMQSAIRAVDHDSPKPSTSGEGQSRQAHKVKQRKRHKGKKKHKDKVFEGQRIEHLAKTSVYESVKEDEDSALGQNQDDYVLTKLFKKSGVHSAMQHDKIMMASDPDYALVEGEAERVAREAVKALKKSRFHCHDAQSGIPTWTGQHGAAPQPKPRFGQKKNVKLTPAAAASKPDPSKFNPEKKVLESPQKLKHFDGTIAGNVKTATGTSTGVMTSAQLLARMKARNGLVTGEAQVSEDTSTLAERSESENSDLELITDIRNFVAFMAHVDGQAYTQELIDHFRAKIPTGQSAKFKAMLRQICHLHKRDEVGIWTLRPEFR